MARWRRWRAARLPSPADAQALQELLVDASTLSIRDVVALWRRYSDNADFRIILEAAFPEIIGQYATAAALATAQWYDELAPGTTDYRAQPVADLPAERFTNTIGWALYAPGQATPLDRIAGAAQRMIFDASRQTVLANLAAEYGDDDGTAELGTRWARYASATACGFCRLLATRKAVYRSAESATQVVGRSVELTVSDRRMRAAGLATTDELLARRDVYQRNTRWGSKGEKKVKALRGNAKRGSRYHDNCRCLALPIRPGQSYEPPDYVAQWEDDYKAARDGGARTPGEIANAMDKAPGGRRAPKVSEPQPVAAPGNSGTIPPVKPPKPPVLGDTGGEPEGWSGHVKGYTHPHRVGVWSETERVRRQDALGVVPVGEQLHQHEIETVERLQRLGETVEWLPKDSKTFLPTNDIRWINNGGIEVDLKATTAKYEPIRTLIHKAVVAARTAGVVKDHFVVDIGQASLTEKLRAQLAKYNTRNPNNRISGLWIVTRATLVKIDLQ